MPTRDSRSFAGCYDYRSPASTSRKLSRPASRFSMICSASSFGSGRLSKSIRFLSLSQKTSRLVLSQAVSSSQPNRVCYEALSTGNAMDMYKCIAAELGLPGASPCLSSTRPTTSEMTCSRTSGC